jgi:hypothetical protein
MSVINSAKTHFKTKLTDKLELLDVPEWKSKSISRVLLT